MRTIIYIEDLIEDYKAIYNILKDDYKIIPSNDEEFLEMKKHINKNTIWNKFLEPKIIENKEDLSLIIMDLNLQNDDINGDSLIYKIRNDLKISDNYFFSKLLPIISLTDYAGEDIAKKALKNGATHNIPKKLVFEKNDHEFFAEDEAHFKDVIASMIRYYDTASFNKNLSELLQAISIDLEYQDKLIKTGFDSLVILIQSNHEETLFKFDLLFNFLFESFDTNTKQRIFDKFKDELSEVIEPESIKKLERGLWGQIKDAVKEVNQGGGFKAFVDTTYEILANEKILGDKGKLVGIAIKGIFSILASGK